MLTAIATPGLADLVVDVLGGGGRLGLGRLGDDGFPLLHCHDGSIEEGKEKEGGERGGGEEWGKRKKKRKGKGKRSRPFQVLSSKRERDKLKLCLNRPPLLFFFCSLWCVLWPSCCLFLLQVAHLFSTLTPVYFSSRSSRHFSIVLCKQTTIEHRDTTTI